MDFLEDTGGGLKNTRETFWFAEEGDYEITGLSVNFRPRWGKVFLSSGGKQIWLKRETQNEEDLFLKNQFLYLDILQIYEIICDSFDN